MSKESTGLDKAVAEESSDRSGVQTELDAVNEYLSTLKKQCVEEAETFAERKARFEAEMPVSRRRCESWRVRPLCCRGLPAAPCAGSGTTDLREETAPKVLMINRHHRHDPSIC